MDCCTWAGRLHHWEFAAIAAHCPHPGSYDLTTSKYGFFTQTQLAQSWISSFTASHLANFV